MAAPDQMFALCLSVSICQSVGGFLMVFMRDVIHIYGCKKSGASSLVGEKTTADWFTNTVYPGLVGIDLNLSQVELDQHNILMMLEPD